MNFAYGSDTLTVVGDCSVCRSVLRIELTVPRAYAIRGGVDMNMGDMAMLTLLAEVTSLQSICGRRNR